MEPTNPTKPSKMTKFICQELLYEFALGRLHSSRQEDMDAYLTGCRESQRELEKLKRGLRFSAQSLGTKLSPDFHAELMSFEPAWKKSLSRMTKTSAQRGWKALPYFALLAVLVTGLAVFKPWQRKDKNVITLVEQLKVEPDSVRPENLPIKVMPTNSGENGAAARAPVIALTPSLAVTETEAPAKSAQTAPANQKPAASQTAGQGMLTRADLEVSDFANSSAKIKEKIQALGGKVAGNVELGWLKKNDESYFHFSLPESNRAELELFLKTFGPVRISSEAHPRVMPEGQIRIILTVKDGGTIDEGREENKTP